jgi:hypothetical protein
MNLKLNFQLSIPHNLDIYGGNISLIDIKPHFMTQDFYLSISVLAPSENVLELKGYQKSNSILRIQ